MDESNKTKLVISGIVLVVALVVLAIVNPFVVISAGFKGVVLHWGAAQDKSLDAGIHWVTPISESVVKMDIRIQKEEVEASAASKDLQVVTSKVAMNFHLDSDKVNQLYKNIGKDYKERVIDPSIQEAVKSATAKYTAEELVTKRELVKEDIKTSLKSRLATDYIIVDELNIINFDFSPSFNAAIEAKVTAEQNALASKNKLEQVKYEAEQRIATAEAEAKSIRLQSDAANNEKFISLKALEVQLEFAKHYKGDMPQTLYIVAGANGTLPGPLGILNLNK